MSVYRRKLTKEANDFFVFLEQKVLKTPIVSARQFAHGAASQNYHIRLNNQQEILVKLTKSYNKQGITRLTKICQAVSSNKQLPVARLISFQQKPFFQYKEKYGLILEYCQGYAVPSYRINKHHFTQIINAYAVFMQTKWPKEDLFIELYPIKEQCFNHMNFIKETIQKTLFINGLKKYVLMKTANAHLSFFERLLKTTVTLPEHKKTIIHGDFHNNNVLFYRNQLVSFLDFEEVGYGYVIEDIMRFILCVIQRLPIFMNPYPLVEQWIKCANNRFGFTKEEWILGLNSYYVQRADKAFRNKYKAGSWHQIFVWIKLLWLTRRYHKIKRLIEKIYA